MEDRSLKIYKASAGSGKTYNLALKYIEHLFLKPDSFKNILAVTFTNKAAGEMKSRILEKLFEMSRNDEKASDYKSHLINNSFAIDEKDVIEKSAYILKLILNNYSGFYVQTIDKFFQWVIRGFTREIGLQSSYNLEMNVNKILTEAIDLMLASMDENIELRNWLLRFAEEKMQEGKTWNFQTDVFKLGQEVFKESYQTIQEEEISVEDRKIKLNELRKKLKKTSHSFESYIREQSEKALLIIKNAGLEISDFKWGKTSVPSMFQKALDKPIEGLNLGSRIRGGLDEPLGWYKKGSPNEDIILNAYNNGLNDLLRAVLNHWDNYKEDYFTALAIWKNIYTFGILTNISDRILEISNENNFFLLSDSSRFLKKIIEENEAPFIYEKSGNYFNNLMLDEFQDTSGFQWQNFYPLIQNSLASGKTNLLVGDVKQAIYRWRNSDWKILATEVENVFPAERIEHIPLNVNYRSLKNLISFNNSVFYNAPHFLKHLIESQLEQAEVLDFKSYWLGLISKIYDDSRQNVSDKHLDTNGFVCQKFFKEVNNTEYLEKLKENIPKTIMELQDRGYRAGDITILVRKGSEGRDIANILMEESAHQDQKYNFNVISNDSLYLKNNSAIKFLISLLRYFNHNSDKLNRSFLKHEFLLYLKEGGLKVDNYIHKIFSEASLKISELTESQELTIFENNFLEYRRLPLFELTEELISVFKLNENIESIAYIQSFQDVLLEYIRKESSDLNSFLNSWDNGGKNATLSISESQDAIRILTIHKAKGLQFKVVILPFCHWKLEPETGGDRSSILWSNTDKTSYKEFSHIPVNYQSKLKDTKFKEEYYDEMFKSYIDNLNLMYVAFTRAENELHVFSKLSKETEKLGTVADLLFETFKKSSTMETDYPMIELDKYLNQESLIFEYGTADKYETIRESQGNFETFLLNKYPVSKKRNTLSLNHKNIYLSDLKEESTEKTGYGTQMHEIFADIIVKTDVKAALRNAWMKGLITKKESSSYEKDINEKISKAPLSDWFSGDWLCKNESDIIDGKGDFFRPDRFMTKNGSAIILDYKFGSKKDKKYHKQMLGYGKVLHSMGYKNVSMYLWYFSLNELEEVVYE